MCRCGAEGLVAGSVRFMAGLDEKSSNICESMKGNCLGKSGY